MNSKIVISIFVDDVNAGWSSLSALTATPLVWIVSMSDSLIDRHVHLAVSSNWSHEYSKQMEVEFVFISLD